MLYLICGEDVQAARAYFLEQKKVFAVKNFLVTDIQPSQIEEIMNSSMGELSLFGQQKVYVTQSLQSYIGRKKNEAFQKNLKALVDSRELIVLDWESGKSTRELSLSKIAVTKEFKVTHSVFQLQESVLPHNYVPFATLLQTLRQTQDDGFLISMMARHLRTLILAQNDALPTSTSPWVRTKVTRQAKQWPEHSLASFYEGLIRLDQSLKTGQNVYDLGNSLLVIAYYYLI